MRMKRSYVCCFIFIMLYFRNELITWREMDERVANTLDYSSSKENNDIDEAINDPHQIMICNGKEEIIYVNSENDFI